MPKQIISFVILQIQNHSQSLHQRLIVFQSGQCQPHSHQIFLKADSVLVVGGPNFFFHMGCPNIFALGFKFKLHVINMITYKIHLCFLDSMMLYICDINITSPL